MAEANNPPVHRKGAGESGATIVRPNANGRQVALPPVGFYRFGLPVLDDSDAEEARIGGDDVGRQARAIRIQKRAFDHSRASQTCEAPVFE